MNYILKKMLSITLVFSLCIATLSVFTNAKSIGVETVTIHTEDGELSVDIKTFVDNDIIRTVQTQDETYRYTITYNKINETMDATVEDLLKRTSDSVNVHIDLNNVNNSYKTLEEGGVQEELFKESRAASTYQNTFSNFEYTKWYETPTRWALRRPDPDNPVFATIYFETKETSDNRSYLSSYMDYVEKINSQEVVVIGAIGSTMFTSFMLGLSGLSNVFTGGVLTPAMTAAVAASIGAGTAATVAITTWGSYMKYAYDRYWEVYNRRA